MKHHNAGLYLLILDLARRQAIKAGRLTEIYFKPGLYIYVGRAKQGLRERIERHLKEDKRFFWHIDYFLQKAEVKNIWVKPDFFDECRMISQFRKLLKKCEIPLKRFGASDCRCPAHLLYVPVTDNLKDLMKRLAFENLDRSQIFPRFLSNQTMAKKL